MFFLVSSLAPPFSLPLYSSFPLSLPPFLFPPIPQVPPDYIRTAAHVVGVLGKTPVLTPSSPALRGSVAHYITLHHWSLAARLLATGLSTSEVDHYTTRAGFSKGPFATMRQVCW